MFIDDEISKQEKEHQDTLIHLLATEQQLERLYTEKRLSDEVYQRLQEEGVDVQITQGVEQVKVILHKGALSVACVARSLTGALLGAHTALRGGDPISLLLQLRCTLSKDPE